MSSDDRTATAATPDLTAHPFEMSWQKATTPLEAIERALYVLADQVSGAVSDLGAEWRALVYPRSASAHLEGLAHQMRQEVTDQTLRMRIAERTDPIRNLVFALAFSRSGLAPSDGANARKAEHE